MSATRREILRASVAAAAWPGPAAEAAPSVPAPSSLSLSSGVQPGRVRRVFVDGPFGQIHARVARPAGRASKPALVCLHQTPLSSKMFAAALPYLATDRAAIAIDTPGYGESDAPATRPDIAGYASSLHAAARALTTSSHFDLLGYHTGAVMAVEMALQEPSRVRRLVLASLPLFDPARRKELKAANTPDVPVEDGSHILKPWKSGVAARGPGQTLDLVHRTYVEKLRAEPLKSLWALDALFDYEIERALPRLTLPVTLLRSADSLKDHAEPARRLLPRATLVERLDLGHGLFDVDPEGLSRAILSALT
jgi:pimeloyl-ACP methyl ester carboxylesterase